MAPPSKLALGSAILSLGLPANAYLYNETIQTRYGAVQGIPALNATCCSYLPGFEAVTVWKGIPFAADTGGANRWKAPQPRQAWNTTLVADTFGSACPSGSAPNGAVDPVTDEDCLNLNIWSSANSTAEKRPVMIWSNPAGSNGASSLFDGGAMALQDIVVVTYNYRTGPFGWLALPELWEESGNVTTGSYGVLDQVAALKWVHENIADFGGDPDRITTVGQSAGSASVYHTVNSPLTKGLIVGAIAESGIRDPRDPAATSLAEGYNNMSTSVALSRELMGLLNVTTVEELRNDVTASDLSTYSSFTFFSNWRATLDGHAIPMTYWDQLQNGPANDVPLITGNTRDESGATYGGVVNVSDYTETIRSTYGDWADRFLKAYPASNTTQASLNTNLLARDVSLTGSWNYARLWAETASSPIYTYYWDHAPPGQDQGAYHMSEITYVFNNLYGTDLPWTSVDYKIANTVNAYWANFIKTQDPNQGGSYRNGSLPRWEPTTAAEPTVFHLSPSAPENVDGLPVGYEQVSVATEAHRVLITDFFESRTDVSL
ncbi:carboxylesterase 2 [Geosmithia morbida]|uniref:Carboxylesterase 2 n=1 Tax=Geosmithia morbida TaxID=1094350 RepID=A0A9P5D0D7_9HYPO|nr:carboxylesterase 2 [Geosmithia morbida]KAF4121502.1 carboxylesterase 2 [Geosmithia morbida]